MESKIKNYNSIDLAKFVMAILVMSIHIYTGFSSAVHDFISNGVARIAVPFFFIASGFFFFRKEENLQLKNLFKTLKRIFLLFLGWTIVYGIYMYFSTFIHGEEPLLNELLFLRRHIFLNPYAHLWFLPALMIGLSLSWFFIKLKLKKVGIIIAVLLFIIGTLGDSYYFLATKNDFIRRIFETYLLYFSNFRNGIFFGFVFIMLYDSFQNYSKTYLAIVSILSFALLCCEYFFVKENKYALDYNMYFSLLIFTPAFFSLLLKTSLDISPSIALFFREYSMGIYFLHPMIKEINPFDFGLLRFPMIIVECIVIIFIVKKLKIPILSFLLK